MAHYCRLDENNIVTQVIVVDNKDCADASGVRKNILVLRSASVCLAAHGSKQAITAEFANTTQVFVMPTAKILMRLCLHSLMQAGR